MVSRKDVGNVLQAGAGDPMAVAKQNINAERIKNEMKHFAKNRTNDFVVNPTKRKCIYNSQSH